MLHSPDTKISVEISSEAFLNDGRALIIYIAILNSHSEDISHPEHQIAMSHIDIVDLELLKHLFLFFKSAIQVNILNLLSDALYLANTLLTSTRVFLRTCVNVVVEQSIVLNGSNHS